MAVLVVDLDTVVAVRITTTSKHATVPAVVALSSVDPLVGHVVADDLIQLYRDELVAGTRPVLWSYRG